MSFAKLGKKEKSILSFFPLRKRSVASYPAK